MQEDQHGPLLAIPRRYSAFGVKKRHNTTDAVTRLVPEKKAS